MGVMKCEIPPEVTAFKEKFFFGLTVRQLLCVAGGLALAIPTGMYGSKILPSDVVEYLVFFEALPFAAIGFFKYNDMHIEVIGRKVLYYYFGCQKRKYTYTPNIYDIQCQIRELDYLDSVAQRKAENRAEKLSKRKKRK